MTYIQDMNRERLVKLAGLDLYGDGTNSDSRVISSMVAALGANGELVWSQPSVSYLLTAGLTQYAGQAWKGIGGQRATTLKKGAHCDLVTMADGSRLDGLNLECAVYTGKGIVVADGFSQSISNVRVSESEGASLHFAADQGSGSKVVNFEAVTQSPLTVPAISTAGDSTARPRFFTNVWLSGGYADFSGANDTFMSNAYVRRIVTSATTANGYFSNIRFATSGGEIPLSGSGLRFSTCGFMGEVQLSNADGCSLDPSCELVGGVTEDASTCQYNSFFTQATDYDATWTQGSGTQPSIGNGTLTATYVRRGVCCDIQLTLTGGTTTTWGNAGTAYDFSLPFNSWQIRNQYLVGTARVFDASGPTDYPCTVFIGANEAKFILIYNGSGVRDATPIAWANADMIQVSFSYICK